MTPSFEIRMAELDAIVAKCAGTEPFTNCVVRDASNRSNRDWPWWGVAVEQKQVDGSESRRITVTVTLRATQSAEPGTFDAEWRAQIWQGVGGDTFHRDRRYDLDWVMPTPEMLRQAVTKLLAEAKENLPGWQDA